MKIEPLKLAPVVGKIAGEQETGSLVSLDKSFGQYLNEALGEVNKLQNDAANANVQLATGKIEDVSQVVIAAEKATIAFQLTMQVRNKVIDAYQEVMRMQV